MADRLVPKDRDEGGEVALKLGCIFAVVFALSAMVLFALAAPILFHGRDMEALGQAAAAPLLVVFGGIGFLVGYLRSKRGR